MIGSVVEKYGAIGATMLAVLCVAIAWASAIERTNGPRLPRAIERKQRANRRDLRRSLGDRS